MQSVTFVLSTSKVKWSYMEFVTNVLVFLLIYFFNLGFDLILVDHQHESSNGRSFFVRVNLEQTF